MWIPAKAQLLQVPEWHAALIRELNVLNIARPTMLHYSSSGAKKHGSDKPIKLIHFLHMYVFTHQGVAWRRYMRYYLIRPLRWGVMWLLQLVLQSSCNVHLTFLFDFLICDSPTFRWTGATRQRTVKLIQATDYD